VDGEAWFLLFVMSTTCLVRQALARQWALATPRAVPMPYVLFLAPGATRLLSSSHPSRADPPPPQNQYNAWPGAAPRRPPSEVPEDELGPPSQSGKRALWDDTDQTNSPWPYTSDESVEPGTNDVWKTVTGALHGVVHRSETRDPADKWAALSKRFMESKGEPGTAYTSRSVRVDRGEVGSAFRRLNAILRRNDVKKELSNERYEPPSAKRRRLMSTRHRRRFAEMMKQKVELAAAIVRRGG